MCVCLVLGGGGGGGCGSSGRERCAVVPQQLNPSNFQEEQTFFGGSGKASGCRKLEEEKKNK